MKELDSRQEEVKKAKDEKERIKDEIFQKLKEEEQRRKREADEI